MLLLARRQPVTPINPHERWSAHSSPRRHPVFGVTPTSPRYRLNVEHVLSAIRFDQQKYSVLGEYRNTRIFNDFALPPMLLRKFKSHRHREGKPPGNRGFSAFSAASWCTFGAYFEESLPHRGTAARATGRGRGYRGGILRLYPSDGSFLRASRFTASGVGRPRASSRAALNCAARILRRTWRANSFRASGSVRSSPSGVLKVSNGDGRFGAVRCASRTPASGVRRPRASSSATRSWAARIPLRIRRMVSSLDARASPSAADIGSPLSVRCIHHLRDVHNRQGFASPRRKMHELWEGRRDGSQRSLAGDGMGLQTRFSAKGFAG